MSKTKIRHTERVLGVEVFTWDGWDTGGDHGEFIFYNVEFLFEDLKHLNGKALYVSSFMNEIAILEEDGSEAAVDLFQSQEFKDALQKRMSA